MRLSTFVLASLYLFPLSLAQNWAIDESCDNEVLEDPTNPEEAKDEAEVKGPLRPRDGIIAAMDEARARAQIAFDVMSQHANDERVSKICKMVLGDDEKYEQKFSNVRAIYEKVMNLAAAPADPGIGSPEWNDRRTWDDVQIYCDLSRFSQDPNGPAKLNAAWNNRKVASSAFNILDDLCYRKGLKHGDGIGKVKMSTQSSILRRYLKGVPDIPQPDMPYTIDVCPWFVREWQDKGFIRLNQEDFFP